MTYRFSSPLRLSIQLLFHIVQFQHRRLLPCLDASAPIYKVISILVCLCCFSCPPVSEFSCFCAVASEALGWQDRSSNNSNSASWMDSSFDCPWMILLDFIIWHSISDAGFTKAKSAVRSWSLDWTAWLSCTGAKSLELSWSRTTPTASQDFAPVLSYFCVTPSTLHISSFSFPPNFRLKIFLMDWTRTDSRSKS